MSFCEKKKKKTQLVACALPIIVVVDVVNQGKKAKSFQRYYDLPAPAKVKTTATSLVHQLKTTARKTITIVGDRWWPQRAKQGVDTKGK